MARPTYIEHRYECLVCNKQGVLWPENWLTGTCKYCASDMILPIPDLLRHENIVHLPVDSVRANVVGCKQITEASYSLEKERHMKIIKELESKINANVQEKFGQRIKASVFGSIKIMNELQLDIAKYRHTGPVGLLTAAVQHFKAVQTGMETLEETPTHYMFTSRVSECGTLTVCLDKREIAQVLQA